MHSIDHFIQFLARLEVLLGLPVALFFQSIIGARTCTAATCCPSLCTLLLNRGRWKVLHGGKRGQAWRHANPRSNVHRTVPVYFLPGRRAICSDFGRLKVHRDGRLWLQILIYEPLRPLI